MKRYWNYFLYVCRHKWFVFLECCALGIPFRGIFHDLRKLGRREFITYAHHFYNSDGTSRADETAKVLENPEGEHGEWLRARRLHVISSRHHSEYWTVTDNNHNHYVLPMGETDIREMVADWRGVARALGKPKSDTLEWWNSKGKKLTLHEDTKKRVEELLAD